MRGPLHPRVLFSGLTGFSNIKSGCAVLTEKERDKGKGGDSPLVAKLLPQDRAEIILLQGRNYVIRGVNKI
jgi:hypothetical protein